MKKFIRQSKRFWKQTVLQAALAFLLSAAGAASLPAKAEAASLPTEAEAATEWTPISAPDGSESGLFWSYDEDAKTLTISGTGELGKALHEEPFQSMEIKKVEFQACKAVGSMAWAFGTSYGSGTAISEVEEIDFAGLDTSAVTDMSYMFSYCRNLSSLDLSSFNTSNVTNMNNMFVDCKRLEILNLSSFDTSNVTDMSWMFCACAKALKTLDLSSFDTSSVTNMQYMFYDCLVLSNLDLSSFNTANVTNMQDMFGACVSLKTLNLGSFDTANVTKMSGMFYECRKLAALDLSSFDTSNVKRTGMEGMFENCNSLAELKSPHVIVEGRQADLPATFFDADLYESIGEYRTMTVMDASCAGKTLKKYSGNTSGDNGDGDDTAEPLPDAVQYVMYEYTLPGSSLAQNMSLLEGTLPVGMELQAGGKLCGIPAEAGEFVFTVGAGEAAEAVQTVSGGDGSTSGVSKTYKLTVSDNSDAHVNATTDQGYEILQRIPDFTGDSVSGCTLVSEGAYDEFREVYIDGVKLKAGEDYTSEAGSTHINIKSGTMERFSGAGIHTILVEFRAVGTNELKCAVQNYRVVGSSDDGRGEGSTGNDNIGSDNGDDSGSDSGDAGGSDNGGDGSGSTDDDDGSDDGSSAVNQNGTAANTPIKYMVVSGDVLGRIARRNGISLTQLLAWNPQIKNPSLIFPGQMLVVGYAGGGMEAPALQTQEGAVVDVVQKGDSLYRIAVRNGVSLDKVATLNPELMKQKYIYPGQKVRVK